MKVFAMNSFKKLLFLVYGETDHFSPVFFCVKVMSQMTLRVADWGENKNVNEMLLGIGKLD